jgi:hypothetical protein
MNIKNKAPLRFLLSGLLYDRNTEPLVKSLGKIDSVGR